MPAVEQNAGGGVKVNVPVYTPTPSSNPTGKPVAAPGDPGMKSSTKQTQADPGATGQSLTSAIDRMFNQGYSYDQIEAQIRKWHPTWTQAEIAAAMSKAGVKTKSAPKNSNAKKSDTTPKSSNNSQPVPKSQTKIAHPVKPKSPTPKAAPKQATTTTKVKKKTVDHQHVANHLAKQLKKSGKAWHHDEMTQIRKGIDPIDKWVSKHIVHSWVGVRLGRGFHDVVNPKGWLHMLEDVAVTTSYGPIGTRYASYPIAGGKTQTKAWKEIEASAKADLELLKHPMRDPIGFFLLVGTIVTGIEGFTKAGRVPHEEVVTPKEAAQITRAVKREERLVEHDPYGNPRNHEFERTFTHGDQYVEGPGYKGFLRGEKAQKEYEHIVKRFVDNQHIIEEVVNAKGEEMTKQLFNKVHIPKGTGIGELINEENPQLVSGARGTEEIPLWAFPYPPTINDFFSPGVLHILEKTSAKNNISLAVMTERLNTSLGELWAKQRLAVVIDEVAKIHTNEPKALVLGQAMKLDNAMREARALNLEGSAFINFLRRDLRGGR